MDDTTNIDQLCFELDQKRGHYGGMSYPDYQVLKLKETEIAKSSETRLISVDEVCQDIARVGSAETQRLPKAFFDLTEVDSRRAYSFGEEGLVVYFAVGTCQTSQNLELGLISGHMPGNSGGGGWGSGGTRRLQLVEKPQQGVLRGLFQQDVFDHKRWLENTLAYASEWYDSKIRYTYTKDPAFHLPLKIAIEAAGCELK